MASVLAEIEATVATLERLVDRLEPGTWDVGQSKRATDLFARGERLCVAGKLAAARRVEEAVTWKRDGHRSGAHWLASATGVSVGAAARSLETARRLEELPETAEAFRAGELSEAQASAIARKCGSVGGGTTARQGPERCVLPRLARRLPGSGGARAG